MQVAVLKLNMHDDDRCKRRVMKIASTCPGIDSISIDMKEHKLTMTGNIDLVTIVNKLRKVFDVEVISIGPVKEPEKKKEEPKKEAVIDYIDYYHYHPTYPVYSNYYY